VRIGGGLLDVRLVQHHVRGVALVPQRVKAAYARLLKRGRGIAPGLREERLEIRGLDAYVQVDDEHPDHPALDPVRAILGPGSRAPPRVHLVTSP
jgi:hypothetical protein